MLLFSSFWARALTLASNGKLSVMKKPAKDQVSASMLGIAVPDHGIDAVVISDGELSKFSLELCHLTEEWYHREPGI